MTSIWKSRLVPVRVLMFSKPHTKKMMLPSKSLNLPIMAKTRERTTWQRSLSERSPHWLRLGTQTLSTLWEHALMQQAVKSSFWPSSASVALYSISYMRSAPSSYQWNRDSEWLLISPREWTSFISKNLRYFTETWSLSIFSWLKKSKAPMTTCKSRWPISDCHAQSRKWTQCSPLQAWWQVLQVRSIGWHLRSSRATPTTVTRPMCTLLLLSCGRSWRASLLSKGWDLMRSWLKSYRWTSGPICSASHRIAHHSTARLWSDAGTQIRWIGLISAKLSKCSNPSKISSCETKTFIDKWMNRQNLFVYSKAN